MRIIHGCAIVLCFALIAAIPSLGVSRSRLVVDDDKKECPSAGFAHIQDAVNAASPGDEIRICKGTYIEQVRITKPLDLDADSGAVLMPANMQANTASLFSAAPVAAALLISSAVNVSISGLTVDGALNGIGSCTPDLIGIYFQNASGDVDRVAVRNFKLSASLNGCQSGTGVFVQSGGGGVSEVRIRKSSIHDFQKNGITANEIGTTVGIEQNAVIGLGATTGAAQNGIQIGFGAGGSIRDNTVSNMVWAPCTSTATCAAVATNILVTQSDGVEISGNRSSVAQVNIFVDGSNAHIRGNQATAAQVFDGVRVEGDSSRVRGNEVNDAAEAGIFLSGNNNTIVDNTLTEAAVGILKDAGSAGNIIAANRIFDAPVLVQDPASLSLSKLVIPMR
jgi:parallel beta-helix repeat protein